jgi:hypothetical protein
VHNLQRYIEESVMDSFRNIYKLTKTFSGATVGLCRLNQVDP